MLAILLPILYIAGRVWEEPACHGSDFGEAAPMRQATMPGVSVASVKLFNSGRIGPVAVRLGCAYLDVEPHAGQVLSISWLEFRRGQSLVVYSRFRVVGRMSVADKPTWREGVSFCGEQS